MQSSRRRCVSHATTASPIIAGPEQSGGRPSKQPQPDTVLLFHSLNRGLHRNKRRPLRITQRDRRRCRFVTFTTFDPTHTKQHNMRSNPIVNDPAICDNARTQKIGRHKGSRPVDGFRSIHHRIGFAAVATTTSMKQPSFRPVQSGSDQWQRHR